MNIKLLIQGLALTTMLVGTHLASAASFNLCTGVTTKTMPDGNTITMWGYGLEATPTPDPTCGSATVPGPELSIPSGENILTINLRNTLTVPTSIMILGLASPTPPAPSFFTPAGDTRARARSMTHEATSSGGLATYTFTATPGTYLYQSGSHPAVQVQMGLYGGVTNDAAAGQAYTGITYDNEVVLLYSEIDPALHSAVANLTYGTPAYPSTINYVPKYFLVNGVPYTGSTPNISAGTTGQTTLLRFLNAGLESHAPVLQGESMNLIAEYGSPYPYPRKQYSLFLAAGQTKDALFTPNTVGRYAVYDRRLRLTNNVQSQGGLLSFLNVTAAVGTPITVSDSATTDEDTVSAPINIAGNDTDDGAIDVDSIYIPFQPANGTVVINNDGTGTVTYTPNANFNGVDTFNYIINDNLGNTSAPAEVSITVNAINDAPVANDESYAMDAIATPTLSITLPGILENDTDIDLNALTAILQTDATGGVLILNPNGSFDYTPNPETISDTFTYVANDGVGNSNIATVTINITSLPSATLVSPLGNGVSNPVNFTWSAVANASEYRLLVVNSAGNLLLDTTSSSISSGCSTGTGTCSISSNSLTNGSYWWGIQAKNLSGTGAWSTFVQFSIGTGSVPVAPNLILPAINSSGVASTPIFTWDALSNATEYRLLVVNLAGTHIIDETQSATTTSCPSGTGSCSISPTTSLSSGSYWWSIQAKNAYGWGAWSSFRSFSVGLGSSPIAPTLITPLGNSSSTPIYSWSQISSATKYRLLVVDPSGNHLIDETNTATVFGCATSTVNCSITPTVPATMISGNSYWWSVQASNSFGWGLWSSFEQFLLP